MKYITTFANHSAYNSAKDGLALPNVSHCVQENDVHYNPVTPPQPIAPVGKVQVFANPQCTAYADGQSYEVWVRVNQAFGFDDEISWGNAYDNPNNYLLIATSTTEYPNDGYGILLWVDFNSYDRDNTEPFVSGEIIKCSHANPPFFAPIDNPQVIFE